MVVVEVVLLDLAVVCPEISAAFLSEGGKVVLAPDRVVVVVVDLDRSSLEDAESSSSSIFSNVGLGLGEGVKVTCQDAVAHRTRAPSETWPRGVHASWRPGP